jgi:hypothetical protein
MPGTYVGRIEAFAVSEKSPHGQIVFRISNSFPFNGEGPDFIAPPPQSQTFKLDEDSCEAFAGMASICTRFVNEPASNSYAIIIEVHTGAADEIDKISITS